MNAWLPQASSRYPASSKARARAALLEASTTYPRATSGLSDRTLSSGGRLYLKQKKKKKTPVVRSFVLSFTHTLPVVETRSTHPLNPRGEREREALSPADCPYSERIMTRTQTMSASFHGEVLPPNVWYRRLCRSFQQPGVLPITEATRVSPRTSPLRTKKRGADD